MTIQHVSEFPATEAEQIAYFAKLLSKSEQRRKVFLEICRGKSTTPKSAEEISARVGFTAKRVLEIASKLAVHELVEKIRHDGRTSYKKYPNVNAVKDKIIRLATDSEKLAAHVTKRNPKVSLGEIRLRIDTKTSDVFVDARHITVDDIENFSKVRSLKHRKVPAELNPPRLPESVFKGGLANVLGNKGVFKDWGGEKNDLYTSHLKIKKKRYPTAIGLKGPAKKGPLTPGKMGHNGDQIQRLFDSDAQVFLVQYEGEIAEAVSQQLRGLAVNKSVEDRRAVFYGVIALEDSYRLRMKYPNEFKKAAAKLKSK